MRSKFFLFVLALSCLLKAQEWSLPSKDWFYFGVEAGASYDMAYDWSFSWRKGLDVDRIGNGINASIGINWGKEYQNGFIWGLQFSYGYGLYKGKDNSITSKVTKGDDLNAHSFQFGGVLAGLIFIPSKDPNFIPAIQLGVDLTLLFQDINKGSEGIAFGVSPAFGLRGGFSAIINQDYQIDVLLKAPVGSFISNRFGVSVGFKRLFW